MGSEGEQDLHLSLICELDANNAEGVREIQPSGWSEATTLGHLFQMTNNPEGVSGARA